MRPISRKIMAKVEMAKKYLSENVKSFLDWVFRLGFKYELLIRMLAI